MRRKAAKAAKMEMLQRRTAEVSMVDPQGGSEHRGGYRPYMGYKTNNYHATWIGSTMLGHMVVAYNQYGCRP